MNKFLKFLPLVLCISAAHAESVGTGYSVSGAAGSADFTVVNNVVVMSFDGFSPGGLTVANIEIQNSFSLPALGLYPLSFSAASGYTIDGYDVTYNLNFKSSTYRITGNEFGADFGGLKAGDLFGGTATFTTEAGTKINFAATDTVTSYSVADKHFVSGSVFSPGETDFVMTVRGLSEFCPDKANCGPLNGATFLQTSLNLQSITVAPRVSMIAAVPEPSTYALTLAGLCGVAALARRRAARK
jgi:hypothetical protein